MRRAVATGKPSLTACKVGQKIVERHNLHFSNHSHYVKRSKFLQNSSHFLRSIYWYDELWNGALRYQTILSVELFGNALESDQINVQYVVWLNLIFLIEDIEGWIRSPGYFETFLLFISFALHLSIAVEFIIWNLFMLIRFETADPLNRFNRNLNE